MMESNILSLKSIIDLPQTLISKIDIDEQYNDSEVQGGIIENSKYCWIASGAILEIFCIKTGSKIASWKFGSFYKSQYTCITSICKIPISEEFGSCLLAIGLCHGVNDGSICIFAIQGCRILLAINIGEPVTKICLVDSGGNLAGPLSAFDGVLAVTTNKENAYLIDLCRQICIDALELGPEYGFDEYHIRQCAKVRPNANYELLKELAMAKDEHIALNIYSVDIIGSVTSLLMVQQISALVIGSNTGAFVIIDLIGFKIIYKSKPMHGAILQITFQEPSDDPRAHCFLWTLHSNGTKTTANFHQLIYRSKDSSGFCRYQEFLNCNLQYTMVLGKIESRIISCQVIQKLFQDECAISVCTFSWIAENKLYLCIFDIDQWYKFGMGNSNIESRLEKIVYNKFQIKLDLDYTKLRDIKLSTNTLSLFKSCQAFDEYYHPGSLTFDCDVLSISKNFCFHWPGSQKQILQKLSNMGSAGLIAPESLYLECLRTHLIPLFHDNSFDCETSTIEQREMLLSIALDYGFISYLQKCAIAWADGSHAGHENGPTLYTMIDWIWKQTLRIKKKSNALCIQLFDNSGVPLDNETQKQFTYCLSQFHMLITLLKSIIESCKEYLSTTAFNAVCTQKQALEVLSQYFDVIQFLVNLGLLPEVTFGDSEQLLNKRKHVPYPVRILKNFYSQRRTELTIMKDSAVDWGCNLLFIDAFIEYECGGSNLRSIWLNDGGSSFYPPDSLQALLWIYLQPDIALEKKHVLFMYMLLDLVSVLDKDRYAAEVSQMMQFSDIFEVNRLVIRNTRSFWCLDQKDFKPILELIATPVNGNNCVGQWQYDLLLSSLFAQGAYREALQILRLPGPSVSPELKIKILLENQLLSEAFECQRIWGGKKLLQLFFEGCIKYGNISSVMGLSLTPFEEYELGTFLRNSKSTKADNLQVLYYLQRSRFAEAMSVNKSLQRRSSSQLSDISTKSISTREMIIRAFEKTLPDVMTKLTKYCDTEKKFLDKSKYVENPTPLSVSVVRMPTKEPQSRSSALMAFIDKSNEVCATSNSKKRLLGIEDMPFLRTPIANLCNDRNDSLLVYPKCNDYENHTPEDTVNGFESPAKRQKLETPRIKRSSRKEKSLIHRVLRLNSTPYNFDKAIDRSIDKQSEDLNDSSSSLSLLSSPSNKSIMSNILNTPLIKRKRSTNIGSGDRDIRRHSILKSNKSLLNTSQGSDSSRSIHFADADNLVESSEPLENATENVRDTTINTSKRLSFDVITRQSLRPMNNSEEKSKSTTITTSSTSTSDDIYYSLSSNGTNEREKELSSSISKNQNFNNEVINSEDSNQSDQSDQSDKPSSAASSDIDFDMKCKEIVKTGPKCRRSVRLSKSNDSLQKLKQLSTSSPISKAKSKSENRTQKLIQVPVTERKTLTRMVLENNATKLLTSIPKNISGPKPREPIHSVCSDHTERISLLENASTCETNQNQKSDSDNDNIYTEKVSAVTTEYVKITDTEINAVRSTENESCKDSLVTASHDTTSNINPNYKSETNQDNIYSKTDAIYNDIYCEDKLEENDLYKEMMSDINEPAKHDAEYLDVEPMQTCPDVIMCDDRSTDALTKVNKEVDENKDVAIEQVEKNDSEQATSDLHSMERMSEEKFTSNNKISELQHQSDVLNKIEDCPMEIPEDDMVINNVDTVKVVSGNKDDSLEKENDQNSNDESEPETILIDTSDGESDKECDEESIAAHDVGIINLDDDSSASLRISENMDEEEADQEENEGEENVDEEEVDQEESEAEEGVDEEEVAQEESEAEEGVDEDEVNQEQSEAEEGVEEAEEDEVYSEEEEIESLEKNILEHSSDEEEDSEKLLNDAVSNEECNKSRENVLVSEEKPLEEKIEVSSDAASEEMVIASEQDVEEQSENSNDEQSEVENEKYSSKDEEKISQNLSGASNEQSIDQSSNESQTINTDSMEYQNDNNNVFEVDDVSEYSSSECSADINNQAIIIDNSELLYSSTKNSHESISAEVQDSPSKSEDYVENKDDKKIKSLGEILEVANNKNEDNLEDKPQEAYSKCIEDVNEVNIDSTANITEDLSRTEDEVFLSIEDNDDEVKILNHSDSKSQSTESSKVDVLNTAQILDVITNSDETNVLERTISNKSEEDIVTMKNADKDEEQTKTPVTRRRSRRLSGLMHDQIEADDKLEDCDNVSIGSGASVRSTRSRTRRLSQEIIMPNEVTPRRSARFRSIEKSPPPEKVESEVTKTRGSRRKSIDSSPLLSSPNISKVLGSGGSKAKRRSLLAALSEPVIIEEVAAEEITERNNASKDDQIEEYSKGRRLTRNQRSMLMKSLSSSEQIQPALTSQKDLRKRRNSCSTENSESGDEVQIVGSEQSPTISESSSVQSSRRSAFLKAQNTMKTPVSASKRTRRSSRKSESEDSDTSDKSSTVYKFAEPTDLDAAQDYSYSVGSSEKSNEKHFHFSPPKRLQLSTIIEEDSLSNNSLRLTQKSDRDEELHKEISEKQPPTAKKGRSRRNSTSETTPSTRSSSRISTRSSKT